MFGRVINCFVQKRIGLVCGSVFSLEIFQSFLPKFLLSFLLFINLLTFYFILFISDFPFLYIYLFKLKYILAIEHTEQQGPGQDEGLGEERAVNKRENSRD